MFSFIKFRLSFYFLFSFAVLGVYPYGQSDNNVIANRGMWGATLGGQYRMLGPVVNEFMSDA